MAYTILNNDGTLLARVADTSYNSTATSVTFVGRDYSGYGQFYNQNLVTLLTNSASHTLPTAPIKGQLWYDTSTNKLKVFNTSFDSLTAVAASSNAPDLLSTMGEFWYDQNNKLLNFNSPFAYGFRTISTYAMGEPAGWIVPLIKLTDNTVPLGVQKDYVTLLYNQDPSTSLGALSHNTFVASTASTALYFAGAGQDNFPINKGLNIVGSISASGALNQSAVILSGYNQKGGTGYHGFLETKNTNAVNGGKYFRINSTGALEIVNSGYSTTILSLTDAGNLTISGQLGVGPTSGTPSNTSTPASWLRLTVGGQTYYTPLYQ